jgi:hypothetical protein
VALWRSSSVKYRRTIRLLSSDMFPLMPIQPVIIGAALLADRASATASGPAGNRSCPDESFAARYTVSATSDSFVTVETCANAAKIGFANAAYASGNSPLIRDSPLIVRASRTLCWLHGGFVDGSGWQGVYDVLKKDGYTVAIVQNPTTSLADDVAVTKRTLAAQDGPAILVGHSYRSP